MNPPDMIGLIAYDDSRRVIRVAGADACDFLQSILTANVETLAVGMTGPGALLTPQGRILADMMIYRAVDGFLLDCDAARAEDLFTRLHRYKLRRPITLEVMPDYQVWLGWNGAAMPAGATTDPRHADLGWRWMGAAGTLPESAAQTVSTDEWHAVRIATGVPQGPVDLQPERALMLEAGLDKLGAVDFEKGCYVGQEVTARTHYRGLVKRRIVPLAIAGGHPADNSEIHEDDKVIGRMLSHAATHDGALCLAAMKLSDLQRLMEGDNTLTADEHPARLAIPDWMLPLPAPSKTDGGQDLSPNSAAAAALTESLSAIIASTLAISAVIESI